MSKGAKVYVRYKLHLIDFTCEGSSLSAVCEVGAISFIKAQLLGCGNFHRFLVAFMFFVVNWFNMGFNDSAIYWSSAINCISLG